MKFFDLHCDTVYRMFMDEKDGKTVELKKNEYAIDVEKLQKGKVGVQCFAVFDNWYKKDAYNIGLRMIDLFKREVGLNPKLAFVNRFIDFEKNEKNGKISALLTVEDASILENDINKLYSVYDLGVRMIGLNHNYYNEVCHPNYGGFKENGKPDYITPNVKDGLSDFGFELVKEMNKIGVVIDLSHSSDKGFYDVIKTSVKPVMCSHSNARGVCKHVRNLTDDMLYKLADNGGVLGINFCADFMADDPAIGAHTLENAIVHIEYIKKKIGANHIAIGSDFDGMHGIDFKDATYLPLLANKLLEKGYKDSEVEKICFSNAMRVFKDNMR